jgi:Asp-tRNA(Asn)/Glu-tRNA(Gln) amidotransferase A subunit family amidase
MGSPFRPVPRSYLAATPDFAAGKDSPTAFLERCLTVLDAREPQVQAFVCHDARNARVLADAASRRWKEGRPLSPIDGMPIGVKDVIETADMPTGMGSPLFTGWRSGRDSASVKALRDAGAIILGKTVTTEFATVHPGPTRNPCDLTRTPGGSSSGSAAAVATGMVSAALGTQVVGSILRPASYCGCVGFKPSVGAVNRGGSHDFCSQSAQGVLAATLADAWQVLTEIVARAGGDPGSPGLAGPVSPPPGRTPRIIAVLETPAWTDASEAAKAALYEACDALIASGVSVLRRRDRPEIAAAEQALAETQRLTRVINTWESRWPTNIYRDRDAAKLSRHMHQRLKEAEDMTVGVYRDALRRRAEVRRTYESLSGVADLCITLSASGAAPIGIESTGNPAFAAPSSLLGVPALSLPLLEDEGLPLGLQALGFFQRDADLFGFARAIVDLMSGSGAKVVA